MQTFKAFTKPCLAHDTKKLTYICTYPDCPDRLLCLECMKKHPETHENNFVSVIDTLDPDHFEDFRETKLLLEQNEANFYKDQDAISEFFDNLLKEFTKVVSDLKEHFLSTVRNRPSLHKFDALKEELLKSREILSSMETEYSQSRKNFAEAYSEFYNHATALPKELEPLPGGFYNKDFIEKMDLYSMLFNKIAYSGDTESRFKHRWEKASPSLSLTDENQRVSIKTKLGNTMHGAIGNNLIQKGVSKWAMRFKSESSNCFAGIIAKSDLKSLEDIKWKNCYYIGRGGTTFNLNSKETETIGDKLIEFVLDLNQFTLEVYVDGKLWANGPVKKESFFIVCFFSTNSDSGSVELLGELKK